MKHVPVRVGRWNGTLCVLGVVQELSRLEAVVLVVVAGRFVEKGVVIETSSLTEGCSREGHIVVSTRCSLAVPSTRRGGTARRVARC